MIISNEQFRAAFSKLPYAMREYLASDELTDIAQAIGTEHQLHVDTTAAVERETTNMLLGLINPQQFVGELKSVGVPPENVGAIVEELNTKVFIPLREKMKNAPPEEPAAPEDDEDEPAAAQVVAAPAAQLASSPSSFLAPSPASAAINTPSPVSTYQTPPRPQINQPMYVPQAPQYTPAQPAPTPSPIPTYTAPEPISQPAPQAYAEPVASPMPASSFASAVSSLSTSRATPFSGGAPANLPGAMPAPHARTMKEDMEMAKAAAEHPDQRIPAAQTPVFAQSSPIPAPIPAPFIPPTPQTPPAYVVVPITEQIPSKEPSVSQPPAPYQTPQTIPSPQPQTNRDALHTVLKEYGIDPYREPVE